MITDILSHKIAEDKNFLIDQTCDRVSKYFEKLCHALQAKCHIFFKHFWTRDSLVRPILFPFRYEQHG